MTLVDAQAVQAPLSSTDPSPPPEGFYNIIYKGKGICYMNIEVCYIL